MTPRANLLASFSHQPPERIPWVPLVGGVNTPAFVPADSPAQTDEVALGMFLQDRFGCDLLVTSHAVRAELPHVSVRTSRDGDLVTRTTAIGGRELVATERILPYAGRTSSHLERYPVQTREDMLTLEAIMDDTTFLPDPGPLASVVQRVGDRGLVQVGGLRTPIMQLIIDYMGLETFIGLWCDEPERTEQLLATMQATQLRRCRTIAASACEVVGSYDDTSTQLISPDMFRRFVLPALSEYAAICRAAGKCLLMHSCGHVREFLPLYREAGIDVHHYLALPPVGNTTIADAVRDYGDAVTALVAVDPVMLERASAGEVREQVRGMLDAARGWSSFAVITASKPQVPEANLDAVAAVLRG